MKIDYIELLDQLALWLQNVDSQTLVGGIFSLLGATVLLSMAVRYMRGRKGKVNAPQQAESSSAALYQQSSSLSGANARAGAPVDSDDGQSQSGDSSTNEPGGSLELILRQQRLIDNLAERVQALEGYLEMMSSRQQKSEVGHRDRLYYQDAIRAAKAGASADELAEQYNLPAAEAKLIISLSGHQARAA